MTVTDGRLQIIYFYTIREENIMAMVVKNNMSAINTLNTLNTNSNALTKSLAKVSSGMKINGAADDASGYSISEKMRVRIRGLDQATANTQNATSMLRTAEGAVQSTIDIMRNIKEKALMKQKYLVAPNDKRAIVGLNIESMFTFVRNLFKGLDLLFLLVGIGTLLAGAIGVSNIMMVTVKERTTEIGIRRAIGATPKTIISQVIAESITLTMVSGMFGIIFSVMILGMVELGFTKDGVMAAQFQVTFWQALLALLGLITLGVLAGLAPASRAMQIKPVDAMREE